MNRRKLLKSIIFGLTALLTDFSFKKSKVGYISIFRLPNGTRSGDWIVINNKTNKPLYSDKRIGEDSYDYSIQSADDIKGCVSITICKKNAKNGFTIIKRNKVVNDLDITVKYAGTDKRYLQYA